MSFNGSGTFNINTTGQPVVTNTVISSTVFNALTSDLATGLSTTITKDGQTATTARIPFAAGISSTLATDATSTTTGSIITAGGISAVKALWIGGLANIAGATTLQSALTYGGVTLSNAVTGTGSMVLSTSPTITTSIVTGSTFTFAAAATTLNIGNAGGTTAIAGAATVGTTLGVTGTSTLAAVNASGNITSTGGAFASLSNGQSRWYSSPIVGMVLYGQGSSNDFYMLNSAGSVVMSVATGSTTVGIAGAATVGTTLNVGASYTSNYSATFDGTHANGTGIKITNSATSYTTALGSWKLMIGTGSANDAVLLAKGKLGLASNDGYIGLELSAAVVPAVTIPGTLASGALTVTGTGSFTAAAGAFTGIQVGTGATTTRGWVLGNVASAAAAMWITGLTNSATNYSIEADGNALYLNAPTTVYQLIGNTTVTSVSSTGLTVTGTGSFSLANVSDFNNALSLQNVNVSTGISNLRFSSDATYYKAAIGLLRQQPNGTGSLQFFVDNNNDAADVATGDLIMSLTGAGVYNAGYVEGTEQTAPSAPGSNGYRIFAQDNGAGKTQLMVIFASGAAQQIAIQP